jgi:DHA3 family tetracycline resistance protein-like MFS transporter
VLEETGSGTAMGTVLLAGFAPMLVFLLIGGVVVDRLSRVRVMLASDLLRAAVVLAVAVLAFSDRLDLWHVYVLAFTFGVVDAFFQPAFLAAVPETVPADDLPSANALAGMSLQLGRIGGPALGGAIVGLGGTGLAFALDGVTFLVSAACLVPLLGLRAQTVAAAASGASLLRDLRDGIATVLALPWLWLAFVTYALTNMLLEGPYSVALPFLVRDDLGMGAETLGLLYAIFPLGFVLGGVWVGRRTRLRRRGLVGYGGLIVAALALASFGLQPPLALLCVAALVNGIGLEINNVTWTSAMQQVVPREKLGRVASIETFGSFALLPLGYVLSGWAVDKLGASTTVLIGGCAAAACIALVLAHPAIRRFD